MLGSIVCNFILNYYNVYCSGSGGVWIFSPTGTLVDKIAVPESVTNLPWGNQDSQTLYMTAGKSVYQVRLNIAGIDPGEESTIKNEG